MTMEHTNSMPSKIAIPSSTTFPPLDDWLPLVIVSFTACVMVKKKPEIMSPQTFLTCFQKAMHAVKLLDHCHENNLTKMMPKSWNFTLFLAFTSQTIAWSQWFWFWNLGRSQDFSSPLWCLSKQKTCSSCQSRPSFLSKQTHFHSLWQSWQWCTVPSSTSYFSINWPCHWPCSGHQCDASPPSPCNQCKFCKETYLIELAEWKRHNPATGIQTAKDF